MARVCNICGRALEELPEGYQKFSRRYGYQAHGFDVCIECCDNNHYDPDNTSHIELCLSFHEFNKLTNSAAVPPWWLRRCDGTPVTHDTMRAALQKAA